MEHEPIGPDDHEAIDDRESAYELLQRGHALLKGGTSPRRRRSSSGPTARSRARRRSSRRSGRAYYNSGQHDRSRETFERVLELDPSAHYAHFALGQSLKQLGRRSEARTHLRLAVALSPTSKIYAGALARLGPAD
jgi:tetratricopeptide (TPR) repeat protein